MGRVTTNSCTPTRALPAARRQVPNRRGLTTEVRIVDCQGCYGEGFECLLVTDRTAATEQITFDLTSTPCSSRVGSGCRGCPPCLVGAEAWAAPASTLLPPVALGPRPPPLRAGDLERHRRNGFQPGKTGRRKPSTPAAIESWSSSQNRKLEAVEEKTRELLAETAWKSSSGPSPAARCLNGRTEGHARQKA